MAGVRTQIDVDFYPVNVNNVKKVNILWRNQLKLYHGLDFFFFNLVIEYILNYKRNPSVTFSDKNGKINKKRKYILYYIL